MAILVSRGSLITSKKLLEHAETAGFQRTTVSFAEAKFFLWMRKEALGDFNHTSARGHAHNGVAAPNLRSRRKKASCQAPVAAKPKGSEAHRSQSGDNQSRRFNSHEQARGDRDPR